MSTPDIAPELSTKKSPESPTKKYRYFISHASQDLALARLLRAELQPFNKRWNAFRSVQAYLDETNLASNPDLRGSIEEAVNDSEYFILLASTFAAESKWVQDELRMFLALNSVDRVIVVLGSCCISWSRDESDFDWAATMALPGRGGLRVRT